MEQEEMKVTNSFGISIVLVIYCYLERENQKVLKIRMNNSSFFEVSAPAFKHCPPVSATMLETLKLDHLLGVLIRENIAEIFIT